MGEAQRRRGLFGAVAPVLACVALPFALMGCLEGAALEAPERFEALKEPAPPTNCDQPLPTVASDCDWRTPLRNFCARGGCHNGLATAGLNLIADDPLFIARILDVPATYGGISCGLDQCLSAAPVCESCGTCPSGGLLLNKADFASSWIIRKMEPFVPGSASAPDLGCGVAMPPPQFGAPVGYTQAHKDCLIEFFQAVANTGRPCTVSVDGGTDGGT
jgi:hypothetical protein